MGPASDGSGEGRVVVPMAAGEPGLALGADSGSFDELLERGPRTVVVDMSEISHVSSATVSALLWTVRRCSGHGIAVVLRDPSRRCLRTFRRAGLLSVVRIERGR